MRECLFYVSRTPVTVAEISGLAFSSHYEAHENPAMKGRLTVYRNHPKTPERYWWPIHVECLPSEDARDMLEDGECEELMRDGFKTLVMVEWSPNDIRALLPLLENLLQAFGGFVMYDGIRDGYTIETIKDFYPVPEGLSTFVDGSRDCSDRLLHFEESLGIRIVLPFKSPGGPDGSSQSPDHRSRLAPQ